MFFYSCYFSEVCQSTISPIQGVQVEFVDLNEEPNINMVAHLQANFDPSLRLDRFFDQVGRFDFR